jgi:hypothetical protein
MRRLPERIEEVVWGMLLACLCTIAFVSDKPIFAYVALACGVVLAVITKRGG